MIESIEVDDFLEEPPICPFCKQPVIVADDQGEAVFNPCPHTLFIATDDGFEYRSKRFNQHLGIVGMDDEHVEAHFSDLDDECFGIDGITDRVDIPGSVKYAYYKPAPSFLGAYCGFAPPEEP